MEKSLVSQTQKITTIRDLLTRSKAQIAIALPRHMNADRLLRVAMTSIQRNPELLDCDQITLIGAIIQSAQLGLEPDSLTGQAHLVPFWNSRKGRKEVQMIPGYRGLIDLARRSGAVEDIYSCIVYEQEHFEIEQGLERKLVHKPLPPSKRGENKIGVYAVAILKDKSRHFEWLWAEEVNAIRDRALGNKKNKETSPWATDAEEMWKKTAIRRLAKYLPLSPEFVKAATIDEYHDAGISTQELFDADIQPSTSTSQEIMKAAEEKRRWRKNQEATPTYGAETNRKEGGNDITTPDTPESQEGAKETNGEGKELDKAIEEIRRLCPVNKIPATITKALGFYKKLETLSFDEALSVIAYLENENNKENGK